MEELTPDEVRVLGCLVEKEAVTPQSYPLTLNGLRAACNQRTSREPVTGLSESEIELALASLRAAGLVRVVHSPSNRAAKYRHVLNDVWDLHGPDLAVLSVLMLRGPQTPGELKARTERQHRFVELAALDETLDGLATRQPSPFVQALPREPGQKEVRFAMLLGGKPEPAPAGPAGPTAARQAIGPAIVESPPAPPDASEPDLAGQVASLRDELARLRQDFDHFRRSFD